MGWRLCWDSSSDRLRRLIDPTIEHPVRGPLNVSATAGPCLLPALRALKPTRDDVGMLWSKDEAAKDELDGFMKVADEEMSRRKDRARVRVRGRARLADLTKLERVANPSTQMG